MYGDLRSSRRPNQIILGTRLRWVGHVLRINSSKIPKKVLLAEPQLGWKRSRGGQVMTWHRGMKESTKTLATVGVRCLSDWGPKESQHAWVNTLEDMVGNQLQWRSCCSF